MDDDNRVTRNTELRKLSYYQLHQIASQMNHSKNWQQLMMIIPKDLLDTPAAPTSTNHDSQRTRFKYTQEHMRMIEEAASTGRLPAHILFEEWGTSGRTRPTVAHLLNLLVEASLYRAADYLAVDILNESPPARPGSGPAAPVDIGSLLEESGGDLNFDSDALTNGSVPQERIQSLGSTGQIPQLSQLLGSDALVTVEDDNSGAPTVNTDLPSDDVLEGLSQVDIPNLSIFMNAPTQESTISTAPLVEDGPMYQSGVPNMSLFGGIHFAPSTLPESTNASQFSTPGEDSSSTSVSVESTSSYQANNNSLPQLSFLMNNGGQYSFQSNNSAMLPATIDSCIAGSNNNNRSSLVEKYEFDHLSKCTNNFHEEPFTELTALGRKLGAGGFGTVYLAKDINATTPISAVKRLHKNYDKVKEKFDLEIQILSQNSHENLVKLLGYAEDGGGGEGKSVASELCLIYEFVSGGNLERRLEMCRSGQEILGVPQRLAIALGVAKAIDFLHSAELVHRDVKSANVLLTGDGIPKVSATRWVGE